MNAETTRDWSPTLGSLRAFVSVAYHLSWEGVADELGIDATTAASQVKQLEVWLHKALILSGVPLEVHAVDGEAFIEVAVHVLEAMEKHCVSPPAEQSLFWKISLSDLHSFSEISRIINANPTRANFKFVSQELGGENESTTRRRIQKIECALDHERRKRIVSGRPVLSINDHGRALLIDADLVLTTLNESRADISGYTPDPLRQARVFRKQLLRRVAATKMEVSILEGQPKTKIRRYALEERRKFLAMAGIALEEFSKVLGDPPSCLATHIDISALTESQECSSTDEP